jgi:AcrR family transcriptional regulator
MSNSAGRETQELLILTAERLFAQHGIDAVSLREIGEQAGQRNSAVVNYYFGDRAGLVRAIFEYRDAQIEARRHEMINAILRATNRHTHARLRGLIEATVLPFVEQSFKGHYLGFIARLQLDFGRSSDRAPERVVKNTFATREHFRDELSLPETVLDSRYISMSTLTIHTLAMRQHWGEEYRGLSHEPFVIDLIDSLEGLLLAPTSVDLPIGVGSLAHLTETATAYSRGT